MPEIVIHQQQRENEGKKVVFFFFGTRDERERRREKRQCVSSIMASDLMTVVAIAKKAEEANRGKEEEETRLYCGGLCLLDCYCGIRTTMTTPSCNTISTNFLSLMSSSLDAISKQNKKGSNRPKEHRQREGKNEEQLCVCVLSYV